MAIVCNTGSVASGEMAGLLEMDLLSVTTTHLLVLAQIVSRRDSTRIMQEKEKEHPSVGWN